MIKALEMKIALDALETRVVALLRKRYPITVDEIREVLSIRLDTLNKTLRRLAAKGVLVLEPLPDKTFVRLLLPGVEVAGKPSSDKTEQSEADDSIAYR